MDSSYGDHGCDSCHDHDSEKSMEDSAFRIQHRKYNHVRCFNATDSSHSPYVQPGAPDGIDYDESTTGQPD